MACNVKLHSERERNPIKIRVGLLIDPAEGCSLFYLPREYELIFHSRHKSIIKITTDFVKCKQTKHYLFNHSSCGRNVLACGL